MARGGKQRHVVDDLSDLLGHLPWWAGPIVATIAYVLFYWIVPLFFAVAFSATPKAPIPLPLNDFFPNLSRMIAPMASIFVLFIWSITRIRLFFHRKLLDSQRGIETIRDLSWQEFEFLLGEAFRRQGYLVEQQGGSQPDGGVDIRLHKNAVCTLVQCKHWRTQQVGVKIVRELLGVVVSERAKEGIVVTSGTFTNEAIEFAQRNPIRLIDGNELERLILEVQPTARTRPLPTPVLPEKLAPVPSIPHCPRCQSPMVKRTAKKGANTGTEFWGCPRYPGCAGTRNL